MYPVPEAEGLMASFGNVEVAGRGAENINQQPQETTPNTTDNTDTEQSDTERK